MKARSSVLPQLWGSSDSLLQLLYTLPHILLPLPQAWHLACPCAWLRTFPSCMQWGRKTPAACHEQGGGSLLPPSAQVTWWCGPLLVLLLTGPTLTLLPMSLEISACFMAAMRPSIMSEGATMWQPAGKGRRY